VGIDPGSNALWIATSASLCVINITVIYMEIQLILVVVSVVLVFILPLMVEII